MQCIPKPVTILLRLFFLGFIISGCGGKSTPPKTTAKANAPVLVDVMIAEQQSVSDIIEANGSVVASEFLELHPEVSGRLTYLNIAEGSHINKGAVLAKINDADLRAQIAKTRVQLNLSEKTLDRYKQLLDIGGLNQADYDLVLNQINGYKADINYTQTLIDKTVIVAPFSGVIGLRQVSPGAYVTPATTLATLQQTAQVKIDFTLPDTYGNLVQNGSVVDVKLDAADTVKRKATVIAIEPGASTTTRNIQVRALLQGATSNPGAFVKISIDIGHGKTAIKVPTNCIIPEDKSNQLVLVKNGVATFVKVETGIREANAVEITKGVNVGDSIIVRGVLFARPKSPVKVRSVKKLDEFLKADES